MHYYEIVPMTFLSFFTVRQCFLNSTITSDVNFDESEINKSINLILLPVFQ